MKCSACGAESFDPTCSHCGHQSSGVDATGTMNLDSLSDTPVAPISVSDIPAGAAALVVVRGQAVGEVWLLSKDEVEVGRSADSTLFLDDITVSRKHALFRKSPAGWVLEDSGSLNGSYINRELVNTATVLKSGDEIQLGKFRFTFHEGK